MLGALVERPFFVAFVASGCAQLLKVISFMIVEKRVNYRRFVQADGMPNLHAAGFSALAVAAGLRDGFDSLSFAFALCILAIIIVDTMNVKNAASRQAEMIMFVMSRLRKKGTSVPRANGLSYTPLDVFSGVALGVVVSLILTQAFGES
ncbi:MAG: divergent PAP2 family protein [bacterium]|nr:divergent PAP2 family protein [bacterium]